MLRFPTEVLRSRTPRWLHSPCSWIIPGQYCAAKTSFLVKPFIQPVHLCGRSGTTIICPSSIKCVESAMVTLVTPATNAQCAKGGLFFRLGKTALLRMTRGWGLKKMTQYKAVQLRTVFYRKQLLLMLYTHPHPWVTFGNTLFS